MPPNESPRAYDWLRETGHVDHTVLKRAYWERLVPHISGEGLVAVRNESYADADEHTHVVGVEADIVYHCSCPSFRYRSDICKHMVATALALDAGELDPTAVARGTAGRTAQSAGP